MADRPLSEEFQIDLAHIDRIDPRERRLVIREARHFLDGLPQFSRRYLHLDVDQHKEQLRGVPQFYWRALLITDNGRYYAEDSDFGVLPSLHRTFEALEYEVRSRLSKLIKDGRRAMSDIAE